jgi:hypothetical protein
MRYYKLIVPLILIVAFSRFSIAQHSEPSNWRIYKSDIHRFSFSYPPTIAVRTRPVDFFHIEGLVDCIELVDKQKNDEIILRIMISEPFTNPRALVKDAAFLKKTCKKYRGMSIDGRAAINCKACGSAACSWEIVIPGTKQFDIFTLLTKESATEEPKDDKYPIRSIIWSIKWSDPR